MPIRGNRLRWPPRPGKKSGDASPSGKRVSLTDGGKSADANRPVRQLNERDESADKPADDIATGQ